MASFWSKSLHNIIQMGNRYWITGVQIGMLIAMLKLQPMDKEEDLLKILEDVEAKQYLCEAKWMEELKEVFMKHTKTS